MSQGLYLIVVICIFLSETLVVGDRIECHQCNNDVLDRCKATKLCDHGQVCYAQAKEADSVIGTFTVYNHGCVDKYKCSNINSTVMVTDDLATDTVLCGQCCDSDGCNDQPCTGHMSNNTGTQCRHCSGYSLEKQAECTRMTTCGPNEVCFSQIRQQSGFLFGSTGKYFDSGCIAKDRCPNVGTHTLPHSGGGTLLCGQCCHGDSCNNKLCHIPEVLQCSQCSGVQQQQDCNNLVTCQHNEVCYSQITGSNVFFLSSNNYYSGCVAKEKCDKIGNIRLGGGGGLLFSREHVVCGGCCQGDLCNKQFCNNQTVTTQSPTTTPVAITHKATTGSTTTTSVTTSPNIVTSTVTESVTTTPNIVTSTPPTTVTLTTTANHVTVTTGPPTLPPVIVVTETVTVKPSHVTETVTVKTSLVTETVTVKNSPVTQAVTVKPSPVSSTGVTTTAVKTPDSTTTTTSIPPLRCEVCSGGFCGVINGDSPDQLCPTDRPYCLNTVTNSASSVKRYEKRCASETDCQLLWWKETSDKSECTGFKNNMPYFFDFTCHYCCTQDACNHQVVPDRSQLFVGTN